MWKDNGLNGKFLPGLGSIKVWGVLTHTEAMLRQNEAMWLHFGNRYPQHRDLGYELIFKTIEHYFYFNRSDGEPVPIFSPESRR